MQGTYMNNDFSSGFSLTFKTFFPEFDSFKIIFRSIVAILPTAKTLFGKSIMSTYKSLTCCGRCINCLKSCLNEINKPK